MPRLWGRSNFLFYSTSWSNSTLDWILSWALRLESRQSLCWSRPQTFIYSKPPGETCCMSWIKLLPHVVKVDNYAFTNSTTYKTHPKLVPKSIIYFTLCCSLRLPDWANHPNQQTLWKFDVVFKLIGKLGVCNWLHLYLHWSELGRSCGVHFLDTYSVSFHRI